MRRYDRREATLPWTLEHDEISVEDAQALRAQAWGDVQTHSVNAKRRDAEGTEHIPYLRTYLERLEDEQKAIKEYLTACDNGELINE